MEKRNLAVGVDLGGSHVSAGVLDTDGTVLTRKEIDINLEEDVERIIRGSIIPVIKDAMEENPYLTDSIVAVGMGVPGSHDSSRGICHFSPNFNWREVSVTEPIQEALGIPVFMLNDVRSMALGEKHFGAGQGVENFVVCAIGTGIGGGVVSQGRLILGPHEVAGEIGHITVDPNGYKCNCGNYGCVEALASGPNIARRAKEEMLNNKESTLWKYTSDPAEMSAHLLFKAAKHKDPTALKIWEQTGRYLGICFASIVHTVNPSRFILGGRVANAMEFFLPALNDELSKRARMIPPGAVEIVPAGLRDNVGIIGSAALAFEKMGIL